MKKAILFTIIVISTFFFPVQAQVEKGKIMIAGSSSLQLNSGGHKDEAYDELVPGSEQTYFGFEFMPRAGYLIIDNLAAGLFIDTKNYAYKYKDDEYGSKEMTFIAGPFVRYYIPLKAKLIPFVEAEAGYGISYDKDRNYLTDGWDTYKETVTTYRFGAGATFFFNNKIGADLFLGFRHESYNHKDDDSDYTFSHVYNEIMMKAGIVVMLGK